MELPVLMPGAACPDARPAHSAADVHGCSCGLWRVWHPLRPFWAASPPVPGHSADCSLHVCQPGCTLLLGVCGAACCDRLWCRGPEPLQLPAEHRVCGPSLQVGLLSACCSHPVVPAGGWCSWVAEAVCAIICGCKQQPWAACIVHLLFPVIFFWLSFLFWLTKNTWIMQAGLMGLW